NNSILNPGGAAMSFGSVAMSGPSFVLRGLAALPFPLPATSASNGRPHGPSPYLLIVTDGFQSVPPRVVASHLSLVSTTIFFPSSVSIFNTTIKAALPPWFCALMKSSFLPTLISDFTSAFDGYCQSGLSSTFLPLISAIAPLSQSTLSVADLIAPL